MFRRLSAPRRSTARAVGLFIAYGLLTACGAASIPLAPLPPEITVIPLPSAVADATPTPDSAPTAAAERTAAVDQPTAAPDPAATPAATPLPVPTAAPVISSAEEVLFLRGGELVARDLAAASERVLATDVREFAASADGRAIALIRGDTSRSDVWLVGRDGQGLTPLTDDPRVEATPSWAPDGMALVFASAPGDVGYATTWPGWSRFCGAAEVVLLTLTDRSAGALGRGCDPAFSPDGRRIAFASAPTTVDELYAEPQPLTQNTITIVNRRGQNGWAFARAVGADVSGSDAGLLVYAPSWSPDGAQLAYHRYLGVQIETDVIISEIGASFVGRGAAYAAGAGWWRPASFRPDGAAVLLVEDNFGDARGFGGYDQWRVEALTLAGTRETFVPSGPLTLIGTALGDGLLERAQSVGWSPAGDEALVLLPPDWNPDLPTSEPLGVGDAPGELWRWQPGAAPQRREVGAVDFASPIAWLPATPRVEVGAGGYRLWYPADWQLAPAGEFEERTALAPAGGALISAAPYAALPAADWRSHSVTSMFPTFVGEVDREDEAIVWPDGSVYREFLGRGADGASVAGATRIRSGRDGSTIVALYRTTPERWGVERARAQALLAAVDQVQVVGLRHLVRW